MRHVIIWLISFTVQNLSSKICIHLFLKRETFSNMFCPPENKNRIYMYKRMIHDDYKKVDKFSNLSHRFNNFYWEKNRPETQPNSQDVCKKIRICAKT